ncbi:MAG: hypothetical protein JO007_18975 [Alphaproteobacteria bacterium]|nr:hypothetical protein [Alphaproteobacteria bacterium]
MPCCEPVEEDWKPEFRLGVPAFISAEYIPEEELRIRLHRRVAIAQTRRALDALEDEIEDRFGPPPEPVRVRQKRTREHRFGRIADLAGDRGRLAGGGRATGRDALAEGILQEVAHGDETETP